MSSEISRSDNILAVAELLFRAKGYHASSINEVAEMCHMQKASLYHHFSSKEELAIAVMTKVQRYFDTSVFSYAYDTTISYEVRLLKMNRAVEQFFSGENDGCLFANFAIEQMESIPSFVTPIRHYFNSWSNAYLAIFSHVYSASAAKSLADDFVSDLQGALIMMRVTGDKKAMLRLFARSTQALRVSLLPQEKVTAEYYVEVHDACGQKKIKTRA